MKILHLLTSNIYSGAENVACQIIDMFRNDSDIEMAYCSPDGDIRKALNEKDIIFLPLKSFTIKEVRRAIKQYKPDIIHAHDMRASVWATLFCGNTTIISHIHNNSFEARKISFKSLIYLIASIKIKHIIWVSESSFYGYKFNNLINNKSEILYNIIDRKKLIEKKNKDKQSYNYDIVFLGRLSVPKNPIRLMNVIKCIVDNCPYVKVAIVGSGELDDEVKSFAEKNGLSDKISFLGFVENPYKILSDSKLMIMTSLWEGTPMCALEAMSLGVPIVSTPTDGLKYLVKHNSTGFLSDKDEELIDYSINIISNKELRKTMSNNSIKRIKELMNINNYKNKILDIYESIFETKY